MLAFAQQLLASVTDGDSSTRHQENDAVNKRDAKLLGRIATDDRGAMTELFLIYYPALTLFAGRITGDKDAAEDVVHEVMLNLWEKRSTISADSLRAYLYLAVRNRCRNYNRREDATHKAWLFFSELNSHNEGDADHIAIDTRIARMLQLIDALPEKSRRVLLLHHEHKLSYAEIASVLEVSRRTVERLMGSALGELRQGMMSSE